MPPIATGDLITAVQFNELVTSYNKLWGDEYASANFADITTNFAEHSHGWGQASAEPTVAAETIIESSHVNRLLAQMNAGLYHYDDESALISHFSNTIINASYITSTIEDKITNMSSKTRTRVEFTATTENQATKTGLEYTVGDPINCYKNGEEITDFTAPDGISVTFTPELALGDKVILIFGYSRFNSNDVDADIDTILSAMESDIATPTWDTNISSEAKVSFTDYNEARYFFNSGGKLSINLTQDGGNGDARSWNDIFTNTGEIRISALDIINSGENTYTFPGGFYGINPNGSYKQLYTVTGYVSAGDYYGSAYANRNIKIFLKADELGGTFNIYIKVTLTDDVTSGIINTELQADYGYVNQNTTPTQAYLDAGSNGTPYTAVEIDSTTHVYQFIGRQLPTITVPQPWHDAV
tara:strand:+ start:432 stop:1673 length:1242 start_codon:yes stop_codon:yes gene_type:complete